MVLSLSVIAETAPASRRPTAASFMFAGVGLGILMSAVIVPALVARGLDVAWAGLAVAGAIAAVIAVWGWQAAPDTSTAPPPVAAAGGAEHNSLRSGRMQALLLAHALFSMGIVPHTLYWVDYLARGLGLGLVVGGFYWSVVGVFAILGPILTALLARWVGTAQALFIGFLALAFGIAAPALWPSTAFLLVSSMVFGAQPGLSSLMAARVRDLAEPHEMPRVMRAAILSNSTGAVIGGACVPWLYGLGVLGGQAGVFLIGGLMMLAGAVAAMPLGVRTKPAVR
jgi:predicted MFS family arabinose efflux permease